MARGNEIIVTSNPRGVITEGFVKSGQTFYPGMAVVLDPSVALRSGNHTFKYAAPTAGQFLGPIGIVMNLQTLIGRTNDKSIAAGEKCQVYFPLLGEQVNILVKDDSGSSTEDHALGQPMIPDSTGKFVDVGAGANGSFTLLEAITNQTEDLLTWAIYTGHPHAALAPGGITALTDNTGGTADNTLALITSTTPADLAAVGVQLGIIKNNFADLAAKVNAILTALGN